MVMIITSQGRRIEIVFQCELCDPVNMGEYVRAYCHIHGSDHQRSLSINKATGWGHCFNAACDATVLVAEWNRPMARHLLGLYYERHSLAAVTSYAVPRKKKSPIVYQPVLLRPLRTPPKWQQEELACLLGVEEQMRAALVESQRAREYLDGRGIPLEVAVATGVCYLSPEMLNRTEFQRRRGVLRRWVDRIIFPLASPAGKGYIGRSLWRWRPGMDENAHKALLDRPRSPRRWIKTNPAGWFGYEPEDVGECVVLVEGAFDRLTLLAAGFEAREVVALAGTAAQPDWFLCSVKALVLALDADEGGENAARRLAECFGEYGVDVSLCVPPEDGWGKDWNERWRCAGVEGLRVVLEGVVDCGGRNYNQE